MDERDYYGRRRYPRERFEDDWQTRAYEDDERYARPEGPVFPRRHGEGRQAWGMREGPYDEPYYGDEPYGPAHSPAHMRGAGRADAGYGAYGPAHTPAHARGEADLSRRGARGGWDWGAPAEERPWRRERPLEDYAGRGPKGYRRSRERILDDVAERLTHHPDVDASDVEIDVQEDIVILRGRVYDRRQKRTAEDLAESVSGVRDVRNELDVDKGILETLTDAVTGRSDEDRTERIETPPHRTSV